MSSAYLRNLRLVGAGALVTVWAFSHIARSPVLGDLFWPLIAALIITPRPRHARKATRLETLALIACIAAIIAMLWFASDRMLDAGMHSPWIIGPVWLLVLASIARPDAPAPSGADANRQ